MRKLTEEEIVEFSLPEYLKKDIEDFKKNVAEYPNRWDCYFGDLYSSINIAYTSYEISDDIAWYLREKYLGMVRE